MSILKVANYYQVKLAMSAQQNYRHVLSAYNSAKKMQSTLNSYMDIDPGEKGRAFAEFYKKFKTFMGSFSIFVNSLYNKGMDAVTMKDRLETADRGLKSQLAMLTMTATTYNLKDFIPALQEIQKQLGQVIPMDMGSQMAPEEEQAVAKIYDKNRALKEQRKSEIASMKSQAPEDIYENSDREDEVRLSRTPKKTKDLITGYETRGNFPGDTVGAGGSNPPDGP